MPKQVESKICDKCGKRYRLYRVKIATLSYPVLSLICKKCLKAEPNVQTGKVVVLRT